LEKPSVPEIFLSPPTLRVPGSGKGWMQDNQIMQNPKGSSIRVSSVTRRRVGSLAHRLKASSQEEVIDRALDALERPMFWQGFEGEAEAYLKKYSQELAERNTFGQVSGDRMRQDQ
jgi:hypothetical protein